MKQLHVADVIFCLAILGLVLLLSMPSSPVAAAADPGDSCPLWKVAGTQLIYRCEDEQTGVWCYSQGIMLFCWGP